MAIIELTLDIAVRHGSSIVVVFVLHNFWFSSALIEQLRRVDHVTHYKYFAN